MPLNPPNIDGSGGIVELCLPPSPLFEDELKSERAFFNVDERVLCCWPFSPLLFDDACEKYDAPPGEVGEFECE